MSPNQLCVLFKDKATADLELQYLKLVLLGFLLNGIYLPEYCYLLQR